ncbi:MAG TPA: heme peroxidase family protein [Chloroflexota bacterium]
MIAPERKNDMGDFLTSKYGRMFPDLPAPRASEDQLLALGRSGAVMDATDDDAAGDNGCIPAGWTFFGQFIAHDITADRSALSHHASTERLGNFRVPRLDLEAVYSFGPMGSPYLYDLRDPDKFLLGTNDEGEPHDVPRNSQGRALTGDPRNDVHLIISQMHLAFLKLHNAIVDWLRVRSFPAGDIFGEAQRLARWHYQWIVVHEFLPLTVGKPLTDDLLRNGRRYYRVADRPSIPIEFADAAYRYGHSQIRAVYQLNDQARGNIFPDCAGACPIPAARVLDWRLFFDLDRENPPQPTRRIDARLTHSLITLPGAVVGETEIPEYHSLAVRDLLRGKALELPSGEAIARDIGVDPLSSEQLELGTKVAGWSGETPLWYYVLKEADVLERGERLGPVGGRIVAEVLLGLIDADPTSYRSSASEWTPELPGRVTGDFTFTDLLAFAGYA